MSGENVEMVQRVYEGWARGDFSVGVHLLDENVTLVIDDDIPGDGGTYPGIAGVASYMRSFLAAWETLTISAENVRSTDNEVWVEVRQRGTGESSGAVVEQTYFQVWTFRDARVVQLQTILDRDRALEAASLSEG